MDLRTLIEYAVTVERPASLDKCTHAKKLIALRHGKPRRVLAVICEEMTARVFKGDQHVGTWTIRANDSPMVVAEGDGSKDVFVLDTLCRPYVHPHVNAANAVLCWGGVTARRDVPYIMSALLNINLNSAYFRPRYEPRT